jgi:hypothetical protein
MSPSLVVLLLSLGDTPPPVEVTLLDVDEAFISAHPCKSNPVGFCVERARLAFVPKAGMSFTRDLEIFDVETGAKLQTVRVFGGIGIAAGRLWFHTTSEINFIPLNSPGDKPKSIGVCDCGTEATPYLFAVSNDQPLCVLPPESEDGDKLNLKIMSGRPEAGAGEWEGPNQAAGVCKMRRTDFKKNGGMGYSLSATKLSSACKKLLAIKK